MSVHNYLSTPSTCLQHKDEKQNEHRGPEGAAMKEDALSASLGPHNTHSLLCTHAHKLTGRRKHTQSLILPRGNKELGRNQVKNKNKTVVWCVKQQPQFCQCDLSRQLMLFTAAVAQLVSSLMPLHHF